MVVAEMKTNIKISLASARKINLCADMWSEKGLTTSYLGITAHFYCTVTRKLKTATLAVCVFYLIPTQVTIIIVFNTSFNYLPVNVCNRHGMIVRGLSVNLLIVVHSEFTEVPKSNCRNDLGVSPPGRKNKLCIIPQLH